jgi:hypothetical protein
MINLEDKRCLYIGFKQGRRFVGDSVTGQLGLVTLWEHFGDEWREKAARLPDMYEALTVEESENNQ